MVDPPPGVSSMASSPPIASTKPRAMASPRPTPVPSAAWSTRRWNGWNTSSRSVGPDARSAVDDADVDARLRRRARPRPAVTRGGDGGRGVADGVGDEVGERPFEQRRRRRRRRAATRARRPRRIAADGAEAGDRGEHGLFDAGRAAARTVSADACRRLMSSRLPTRSVSRSVSSSIVALELVDVVGRPVDVALAQAGDRRLDRRQRGAQVVGDGLQQRPAQRVGGGEVGRLGRPRRAAARARRPRRPGRRTR